MLHAASPNAVSAALVQELDGTQQPIYFVSRILQDPETRYQMVEKVALALITTAPPTILPNTSDYRQNGLPCPKNSPKARSCGKTFILVCRAI